MTETPENQPATAAPGIAQAFHEAYEDLAPDFSYTTRKASAKPWAEVPDNNKGLMVATVQRLLDRGVITAAPAEPPEVPVAEKCRAVKHGVIDLQCEWARGHEKPQDGKPGTWHEAGFTDRREVSYDGARHVIVTTEVVTWEPVDHAAEAARHLMAGANRSTS